MNSKEARALATSVAKESSNVTVKLGVTNGHSVLHLINKAERVSETIAERWQWSVHGWNKQRI